MLLFGHIGIILFIASLFYLPGIFAVVGVLLPDIVDKGLFVLGLATCGRFFAHSIFFPLIVGLITYGITRKWKFAVAITLGSFFHILQDAAHFIPWFYPLVNYPELTDCQIKIEFGLVTIITESLGAGLLIFTLGFSKRMIYLRKKFWNLLSKIKFW